MTQEEIEEIAQKMENGALNLVEWLEKRIDEDFRKLGFRPMTDEEWEEHKAKRKQGHVIGTITFLNGESARKAAERFKKKSG